MSLKSAIELCQLKVSMAIGASTKEEMLSAAREAEFALSVLCEAVGEPQSPAVNIHQASHTRPPISSIDDAHWPDGASEDNPEAETPIEKRNREEMKNRGFFG